MKTDYQILEREEIVRRARSQNNQQFRNLGKWPPAYKGTHLITAWEASLMAKAATANLPEKRT